MVNGPRDLTNGLGPEREHHVMILSGAKLILGRRRWGSYTEGGNNERDGMNVKSDARGSTRWRAFLI